MSKMRVVQVTEQTDRSTSSNGKFPNPAPARCGSKWKPAASATAML